jgi:hypothetical protein
MCAQYLHHIHPPTPFHHLFPPPTSTNPPTPRGQNLFHTLALQFCTWKKEKKDIFACLKYLHREFPCDTSMHICIGSSPLFFLLSTFVPFFCWFQQV